MVYKAIRKYTEKVCLALKFRAVIFENNMTAWIRFPTKCFTYKTFGTMSLKKNSPFC